MKNKYLIYKEEIADLFDMGNSYAQIAQILIERHGLDVTKDHLRKSIKEIVKYLIVDKEIVKYNVRLAKQNKRLKT